MLMLDVNGYDVHDLGIDVPIEKFVAAIDELKPQVVGLSGLLTLAFDSMKATIAGIADAGLRDQVKIMIGGSPGGRAGLRVHRRRRLGPRRGGRAAHGRRVDGGCGMTPTPEELYAQREQRFNDVVALKKPDRVPVMPLYVHNFPTLIKGISNRDAGYDHETRWQSTKEATLRFGWNFAPTNDVLASDFFAAYGNKQIMWAGEEGGLADDAPFQWVEDEYVKADELAEFVADPNGFTFNKILPRMGSKLEGLGQIPLPPLYWFSNSYYLQVLGNMLGHPAAQGGAAGDARHGRGAGEDQRRQRQVPAGDEGPRLSADLGRGAHAGVRRRLRHLPQPARQHARHVPPAGHAAAGRST